MIHNSIKIFSGLTWSDVIFENDCFDKLCDANSNMNVWFGENSFIHMKFKNCNFNALVTCLRGILRFGALLRKKKWTLGKYNSEYAAWNEL